MFGPAFKAFMIFNKLEKFTMKKTILTLIFGCIFAVGAYAQTTTPPPPASNPGAVVRMVYMDIKPGKTADFLKFLRTNTKVLLDEQKKQGLILDYKFFSKPTSEGPGDWDVLQAIVYRNYADAIDFSAERNAKFDAISIGHYGSVEARTKANEMLDEMRTVVSSHIMREQILNPMPK